MKLHWGSIMIVTVEVVVRHAKSKKSSQHGPCTTNFHQNIDKAYSWRRNSKATEAVTSKIWLQSARLPHHHLCGKLHVNNLLHSLAVRAQNLRMYAAVIITNLLLLFNLYNPFCHLYLPLSCFTKQCSALPLKFLPKLIDIRSAHVPSISRHQPWRYKVRYYKKAPGRNQGTAQNTQKSMNVRKNRRKWPPLNQYPMRLVRNASAIRTSTRRSTWSTNER